MTVKIRYVTPEGLTSLRVLNSKQEENFISIYTKVEIKSEAKGRTGFKVLDGPLKGEICSLKTENANKFLVTKDKILNKSLYVKTRDDGFVAFRDTANKEQSICDYTEVVTRALDGTRLSFVVQDGPCRGMTLSAAYDAVATFLKGNKPTKIGAKLIVKYGAREQKFSPPRNQTLDQQTATLEFDTHKAAVTLNSVWNSTYYPIPAGKYKMRIPEPSHDGGATGFYKDFEPTLKRDKVWFQIEYGNNTRFVHVGHLSHGCVTVMSLDKWSALSEFLLSHRLDKEHVGTLEVIKP